MSAPFALYLVLFMIPLVCPAPQTNDDGGPEAPRFPDNGGQTSAARYVGELRETNHGVSGRVSIRDEDTLLIDAFTYNNRGAAVYVHVSTAGNSIPEYLANKVIVPYPSGTSGEPIERVYAGEQLVIDLKQVGVKAGQVKYLTVWCTIINQSFGYILF